MPTTGNGDFPIITSWGRRKNGAGNTSLFYDKIVASEVSNLVFTDYFFGSQSGQGVLSNTLGTLTSSATGTVALAATSIVTFGDITSNATGKVALKGDVTQTLGALTVVATVQPTPVIGTSSITLDAVTLTSTGKLLLAGTLSTALGTVISAATGVLPLVATASQTLASLTTTATAALSLAGQLSTGLDNLTSTTTSTLALTTTSSATLQDVALEATGGLATSAINGELSATLNELTVTAEGVLTMPAQENTGSAGGGGSARALRIETARPESQKWRKKQGKERDFRVKLEQAYNAIMGLDVGGTAEEADAIVAPFVEQETQEIDYAALAHDLAKAKQLVALYEHAQREAQEEEEMFLMVALAA